MTDATEVDQMRDALRDTDWEDFDSPSISQRAEVHPFEDDVEVEERLTLPGQQLTLNAGGMEPTSTKLTLQGGAILVEGQVAKGDRLTVQCDLVVTGVHFDDKYSDLGSAPVSSDRKHVAKISGTIRRVA